MAAINTSTLWSIFQPSAALPSITDFAIPGTVYSTLPELLTGRLNPYAPIMFIIGLSVVIRTYIYQVRPWFFEYCTTTVSVKISDEAYDMVIAWTSAKGLNKTARSRIARVGMAQCIGEKVSNGPLRPLRIAPWDSSFLFWFQGHLLSYQGGFISDGTHREELISITCMGRSGRILNMFLEVCHQEYLKQTHEKTVIFKHRDDYWKRMSSKAKRPLSTVIVDEQLKGQLVDDIRGFLNPNTRTWYTNRGIPYRRGYLFHGPPGTGKSSLSASIAGEFGLDIYVVDIPSTNDRYLAELFRQLPETCIVLLEDIDAVGTDRSQIYSTGDSTKHSVSLSGLLNTLDGVASQEGQVVIMTTNHIEQLDAALIRPGRIDQKIELSHADAAMTSKLFQFMYMYEPSGKTHHEQSKEQLALEERAGKFAAKVPAHQVSTAQIMSYLLQHKDSPTSALVNAEEWVRNMLHEQEPADLADDPRNNVPNTLYDTTTRAGGIRQADRTSEDLLSAGCIIPPLPLQRYGYRPNTPRSDVEDNEYTSGDEGLCLKRVERYDGELCTMGQSQQGLIEPLLPGPGETVQRWTALKSHPIQPNTHGTEFKGSHLTGPNPRAHLHSCASQASWECAVLSPAGEWTCSQRSRCSPSDSISIIESTFGGVDLDTDSTNVSYENIAAFDPCPATLMRFNQFPVGAGQCVENQAQTAELLVDSFADDADDACGPCVAVRGDSRAAPASLLTCNIHANPEAYPPLLQKRANGISSDLSGGLSSGHAHQRHIHVSSANSAVSIRSRIHKNNDTEDIADAHDIESEQFGASAEILTKSSPHPHIGMKAALYGAQPSHSEETEKEKQFLRDVADAFEQGFVDIEEAVGKVSRAPEASREVQTKLDQHPSIDLEAVLERAQSTAASSSHSHSHSCGNLAPLNGFQTAAEGDMARRPSSKPQNRRSQSSSPTPSSAAPSLFSEIEYAGCMLRPAPTTTPISEYGDREAGQDVAAEAGMQLMPWPSQEGLLSSTVGSLAPMEDTSLRQSSGWAQPQQRRSSSLDSISPTRSTFDQVDNDQDSTTAPDMEEEEEEWTLHLTTEAAFEQYFNEFVDIEAMLLHGSPSVDLSSVPHSSYWCDMMRPPSLQTGAQGDIARQMPNSRDSSPAPSSIVESVFDETGDADSTDDPDIAIAGIEIMDASLWENAIVWALDDLLELQEITTFPQ